MVNLIGQTFNKLTVRSYQGLNRYNNRLWLCDCQCGKQTIVVASYLKSGHTKSCGCLRKSQVNRMQQNRRLPNGEASFNIIFDNYQRRAKKKNLVFDLTKPIFLNLTQDPCYYCGIYYSSSIKDFKYNGIDRVDNSKGYELSNCVTCCKICNYAKNDLTSTEFLQWIERICEHNYKK